MTVTTLSPDTQQFTVDISAESLLKTTGWTPQGPSIWKRRCVPTTAWGHLVSGHVDGLGQVTHFAQVGESWELRIMAPRDLGRYLAYKGRSR